MPAPDRRTIGELLADSDALARETLLDATPEIAPAMVRSWNQLVASAAHLWAALSAPPDDMSKSDTMERLRLVGEAIARSVRAGHWPGHGPTDDHMTEIADNLSRARHLIERDGHPSGPATANRQAHASDIHGQVMHVVCHCTRNGCRTRWVCNRAAAPTGGRHRRRQPMAERPTTLEITEAQGMIARFSGFEQLAAAYMFGQPLPSTDPWPAESRGTGHTAGNSLGCLGGSSAPHPGRQPGSIRLGADRPRAGTHHQHHKHHHRSRSQKRPYRRRCDAAARPGAGGKPGCLEQDGETLGRTHQPSQPHKPGVGRPSQRAPLRDHHGCQQPLGHTRPAGHSRQPSRRGQSLHLSMVASIDIAYVVRDTAANHPGLTAPARIIGMRSQGEAEIAIEQGETRYEGVTWTTRRQIAANRVIPLPEPARRGLINLADEVIATTNRAVAAAAQVDPSNLTRSIRSDRATNRGRSFESLQITRPQNPAPKGPRR